MLILKTKRNLEKAYYVSWRFLGFFNSEKMTCINLADVLRLPRNGGFVFICYFVIFVSVVCVLQNFRKFMFKENNQCNRFHVASDIFKSKTRCCQNLCLLYTITHLKSLPYFCTAWKNQKTSGFLMFWGVKKWNISLKWV